MSDHDPELAHVTPEVRDELLPLAERLNADHGLGLDVPARMGLFGEILSDHFDALMSALGAEPVH